MTSQKRLETNLELLARWQPQVALQLAETPPYDAQSLSAAPDTKRWYSSLDLRGVDLLYIYGVGAGDYYSVAKEWLDGHPARVLVFLDDDARAVRSLLGTEIGSQIMRDHQVRVHVFRDPENDELFFSGLAWDFAMRSFLITGTKRYKQSRAETFEKLRDRLTFEHHRKNEIAQEYLDQGIVFYQNFYPNLLHIHEGYLGDRLFGQFSGVPAIICGAGPSLQKQLPLLRKMRNRALIFAGGSALNALTAQGILPHFACAIDPNFPQYQRLISHTGSEVPFFYRSRVNQRALRAIHGPRLYVTGTGGYDTARYFESRLGLPSCEIDEGHNVVNFATSIAKELGCNPIIYLGLDLAYTDMREYAEGIVADPKISLRALKNRGIDDAAVLRQDIYGKPVYTLWKWIDESKWVTDFASSFPSTSVINATEGGIGVSGIPNTSFQEVAQRYLTRELDLDSKVWEAIQNAQQPPQTKGQIRQSLSELYDSLERCQAHAEEALQQLRAKFFSSALLALTDAEMEQEVAFQAVLGIFNVFNERIQSEEMQRLEWQRETLSEATYLKKLSALLRKRYRFLKRVAKSNLALIDYALSQYKSTGSKQIAPLSAKKRQKPSVCKFVDGKREGVCRRYYADGSLYAEENYLHDVQTGVQRYYYPNGVLKTEVDLDKGVIRLFHPTGKLKRRQKLQTRK